MQTFAQAKRASWFRVHRAGLLRGQLAVLEHAEAAPSVSLLLASRAKTPTFSSGRAPRDGAAPDGSPLRDARPDERRVAGRSERVVDADDVDDACAPRRSMRSRAPEETSAA